jgi:hypothetical protein
MARLPSVFVAQKVSIGDGKLLSVTPTFTAMYWDVEFESRAAWEQAKKVGKHVSIWRMAEPMHPPHRHFVVVILGESLKVVVPPMEAAMKVSPWWEDYPTSRPRW